MSYQLNNTCLTREVLQMIFKNLRNKKDDIKACMLVCKSWSLVAHEFFSKDISITITADLLSNLLKDIPLFSQKVTAIKLKDHDYGITIKRKDRGNTIKEDSTCFRNIVEICPNLVSLTLDCSKQKYFMEDLNSSEAKLDKIQKIHVINIDKVYGEVRTLHLRLNLKYCRTITTLDISTFEQDDSFGVKFDDLHSFIGRFPNLKYLKANFEGGFSMATVNLKQLLNAVPQLQTLKLYKMREIITTGSQDKNLKGALQGSKLTTLRLTAAEIGIKSIKFITSNLINIDRLDFIVKSITPDTKLTQKESLKILEDLKLYAFRKKRLVMEYRYGNKPFYREINRMETWDYDSEGYEEEIHDDEIDLVNDIRESDVDDDEDDFEEYLLDMELSAKYHRCAYDDDF